MVKEIVRNIEQLQKPLKTAHREDLHIIADLLDTAETHREDCLGLTSNQIGYDKRIIVVQIDGRYIPFINPVITQKSKATYEAEEGCLSLDGMRSVKRHYSIRLTWVDANFKSHSGMFGGLTAQIIQHEVDHCNGKLI